MSPHRKWDVGELRRLVAERLTLEEIARRLVTSRQNISYMIEKHGISRFRSPNRVGRKFKYPSNVKGLIEGYLREGRTYPTIASLIGAPSGKAAKSLAERLGLKRADRPQYDAVLLAQYVRDGLSNEEIAILFSAPNADSVRHALRKRGIIRPRENLDEEPPSISRGGEGCSYALKVGRQLGQAEELWIDQLDDRMFNKGSEGRGAVAEPDPGDNIGPIAHTFERSYGASQMGWAA